MRRSSRVILLLGIFLAVGAFILIVFLGGGGRQAATPTPAVARIVVAAVDIPQGTTITESMVTTNEVPLADAPGDSFALAERVVGRTARQSVARGGYIPQSAITGAVVQTVDVAKELKPGERGMSLSVDELTGVGTLIQPGDRVDVMITLTSVEGGGAEIPVIWVPPPGTTIPGCVDILVCETGIVMNSGSVKLIVQNVRVVATLLPAVPTQQGAEATPAPGQPVLSGRTELVIVAVSAQQAEVLRFGQLLRAPMTLLLRAPADVDVPADETTGIILRTLIDEYGVLPPQPIVVPLPPELVPQ